MIMPCDLQRALIQQNINFKAQHILNKDA